MQKFSWLYFSSFTEGDSQSDNGGVDIIVPITVPVIAVVLAIAFGAICYIRRIRIRMQSSNVSKNCV